MADFLDGISSPELSEWLAFDRVYGIPDGYFVVAQLARAVHRAMTGEDVEAGAYVPWFRPPAADPDGDTDDGGGHNMAVMGALTLALEERQTFRE